jgi:hypothetical protein
LTYSFSPQIISVFYQDTFQDFTAQRFMTPAQFAGGPLHYYPDALSGRIVGRELALMIV